MFAKNVGSADRTVRLTIGAVLLCSGLLLLGGMHGSVAGLAIAAAGIAALITGATRRSPLYSALGISSFRLTLISGRLTTT